MDNSNEGKLYKLYFFMPNEADKYVEAGKDALSKTVILIAAGGDASRLLTGLPDDEIGNDFTGVTIPITPVLGKGSFDLILEHIKVMALHFNLKIDLPTITVLGPNTKTAIEKRLQKFKNYDLDDLKVIEQSALPVFDEEGKMFTTPMYDKHGKWIDTKDKKLLLAPNGTGGVAEAFYKSPFFEFYKSQGKEKVLLWHGNFPISDPYNLVCGLLGKAAVGNADFLPLISTEGVNSRLAQLYELYQAENYLKNLNGTSLPSDKKTEADKLLEEVEDNISMYVLSFTLIENIIGKLKERPQLKLLSIRDKTGNFFKGYKFEKFLTEIMRFI